MMPPDPLAPDALQRLQEAISVLSKAAPGGWKAGRALVTGEAGSGSPMRGLVTVLAVNIPNALVHDVDDVNGVPTALAVVLNAVPALVAAVQEGERLRQRLSAIHAMAADLTRTNMDDLLGDIIGLSAPEAQEGGQAGR